MRIIPYLNSVKKFHLNIDYLCCFEIYDGNEALFGIFDCTNRIEIEKNVRHDYGKSIERVENALRVGLTH